MAQHCAACGRALIRGDTRWESAIYGSHHILCEPCGHDEEQLIDNVGTNDLPNILELYGPPNDR
jgi:DNA-directed RNA polymerase subunit RPC12/RpoP